MTISLQDLNQGDTNYIGKHNANYGTIEAAVNALQEQIKATNGSAVSFNWGNKALFSLASSLIDAGSYKPSDAGSANLEVAPGFIWLAGDQVVVGKSVATTLSFSGQQSGTYYIVVDDSGEPRFEASNSGAAPWSVHWNGSSFSQITRLLSVAWGYQTFDAAKHSTALGNQTWQSLDERLEAGERAFVSLLKQNVGGNDITLTTAQAMSFAAIRLQGSQSQDVNLVVPSLEKSYFVFNDCTGGHTVTVKTASGTGIALNNGDTALLYCDGQKVIAIHAPSDPSANPYDVGLFVPGKPSDGAVIFAKRMPRQVTFPAGLTGSQGGVETAADAQAVFSLRKNGAEFGTATIAAAGTSVSFAAASETVFAAGDKLTVVAPSPQDAALEGLDITLAGTR